MVLSQPHHGALSACCWSYLMRPHLPISPLISWLLLLLLPSLQATASNGRDASGTRLSSIRERSTRIPSIPAHRHGPDRPRQTAHERNLTSPPLSSLRDRELSVKEVDLRIKEVKIYVYPIPDKLKDAMELNRKPEELYFHIETDLLEMIQQKTGAIGKIVSDPKEADFFWVQHTLHAHKKDESYVSAALVPFLEHIAYELPYFNQSGGGDHIFIYVWDNGPFCDFGPVSGVYQYNPTFRKVVHPMIIVGYHGMQGYTAYPGLSDVRKHCFWIGHDITLPQLNFFHKRKNHERFSLKLLQHKAATSPANMFYRGTIYAQGFYCSTQIRVWAWHYMNTCDKAKELRPKELQTACQKEYRTCSDQPNSIFGLCPAGWGCWSSRFFDAVDQLIIPVIMSDGMVQPFERWFDYSTFTVKVMTGNMHIINGHNLQGETHLNRIRFPILERLHEDAASFRQACVPCKKKTAEATCLKHPVSRKLKALALHRPWLSWDLDASRNALKLFVLELHCRTVRGKRDPLCQNIAPEEHSAYAEYGV